MRKDINKPKGKTSAYAFFVQTCREEHRKKNPEQSVNFAEFSKKCSERWKALSPSDKKCFEDMAKADKVRYNREMKDYVPPKGFGKRGRKRKDPNAPKRPPSAFFVFCSEYRPSVKQQYPGLSIGDCAKKLGEMWSKLSQSEKLPYEEKAQKLREKYDRILRYNRVLPNVRGRRHSNAAERDVVNTGHKHCNKGGHRGDDIKSSEPALL
uniref:High mobility group protein B2 n=1 Tax=Pundamilia nyererei TaxID=303518 RepID=A0A3B4HA79_9CICH